jgi:2-C-methyl-D-erythritol 4-phosphate cytidylyltransferase
MKKYAIIAAGGSGQRMGDEAPKQFLLLNGKSILWYTVKVFADAFDDVEIVVVTAQEYKAVAEDICKEFKNVQFVEGGSTRFRSVKKGLQQVKEESIVFVHDAARCLASADLLQRCYLQALEKGSAIPSVAVSDSIRVLEANYHKVVDRNTVRIIQTPQTFKSETLLPAFNIEDSDKFTDEATVVEASGKEVHLIEGEHTNIKMTHPIDLIIAERILLEKITS